MKQNRENWALFVTKEIIQCLTQNEETDKNDTKIREDADVVNFILQEVVNQNVLETVEGSSFLLMNSDTAKTQTPAQ